MVKIKSINNITLIKEKKEYAVLGMLCRCEPGSMELAKEDHEWLDDKPVGREAWYVKLFLREP